MTDEKPSREEVLELHMPVLGMRPYVLIEMREASDGSGDPALFVDSGGGAEEHPLFLPLLAIGESAAEGNPVADMLRGALVAAEHPAARMAVENITREFNADWLPFVRGEGAAA